MTANSTNLLDSLIALYSELRAAMRGRWRRDLPFDELAFDRWERARSLGFGEGASIYHNSYVYGDVTVGRHSWVGPFTILDGSGGLSIGDYCSISAGVQIYTHDSVRWALSGGSASYEYAPVTIGNRCYIGASAVVAKGVSIGEGSLVGACAFVNRDVEPNSVVTGIPARITGRVRVDGDCVNLLYDTERSEVPEGGLKTSLEEQHKHE